MIKPKTPQYIKDFQRSVSLLIEMFCKKQETYVEHIVNDDITGIYCIGDCFFNLSDIFYDIKENKPAGLIFEWQNYVTDKNLSIKDDTEKIYINYHSYCMGARVEQIIKKQ